VAGNNVWSVLCLVTAFSLESTTNAVFLLMLVLDLDLQHLLRLNVMPR